MSQLTKSSTKKFVYQFICNDEVTIDNFKFIARPIPKPQFGNTQKHINHSNPDDSHQRLYTSTEIDVSKYSEGDVDEFNNNLWIERTFYTDVMKLLKMVRFDGNPYYVFIYLFSVKFVNELLNIPKEKLAIKKSSFLFWEFLSNTETDKLNRFYLKIKAKNNRIQKDYDSDTFIFIKEAVTYYLHSEKGKSEFDLIKSEYENHQLLIAVLQELDTGNKLTNLKKLKTEYAIKLNNLFFNNCRDEQIRYFVIGELLILAMGKSKRYLKSNDKVTFHFESIRKLV